MPNHAASQRRSDPFTGHATLLHDGARDDSELLGRLCHDLGRGLEAFTGLRRATEAAGLGGLEESAFLAGLAEIRPGIRAEAAEIQEKQGVGKYPSASSGRSLRVALDRFLRTVPRLDLGLLGFDSRSPNPLEDPNLYLRRIGGGVEAWAFADISHPAGWIYKFFMPRPGGGIGATFRLKPRADGQGRQAVSYSGSYSDVICKLILINALKGMPTELCGITGEGILVVKQWPGRVLSEDAATSHLLPRELIPIPSRFVTADRDHPRLFFWRGNPWIVADTHSKNLVLDRAGNPRIIDLVAAPLERLHADDLCENWLRRVSVDPCATALVEAADEEY